MTETSIVRENLMNEPGYSPYCGNDHCYLHWPRTKWDSSKEQFTCKCGWVSQFDKEFIDRYKLKWYNNGNK